MKVQEDLSAALGGEAMSGFEDLYRRHYRRVYAICLRMTCNAAEAEDLAQDVFVLLSRKLHSFRGDAAFTTWLHSLTVNVVLMHFRKPSVKSESASDACYIRHLIESAPAAGESDSALDRIGIQNAVAKLPRGYRAVFILHDVEGHEHEEVARILGCTSGTSKSQLHKARLKLRRLLEGEE